MPDKQESDDKEKWTQSYAALSVGFVCLIIGVPLWWKTTEVYRVSLPYSDITDLTNAKIKYAVDVEVISLDPQFTNNDLTQLSKSLSQKLHSSSDSELTAHYRVNVRDGSSEEREKIKSLTSVQEFDNVLSNKDEVNKYQLILIPKGQVKLPKPYIGRYRSAFYSVEKTDVDTVTIELSNLVKDILIKEVSLKRIFDSIKGARNTSLKPDKESMRSLKYNPGYDITFTLVSPQPDILDVQWDIEEGIKVYLDPLIKQLENYVDFSIKSQVLFFTGLLRRPKKDSQTKEFQYTEKDLPHVINPLEAKLGSHASNNPTLDFLVYVPSRDQSPLYITDSAGKKVSTNSFLSPRWGGIYIYNVPSPSPNDTLPVTVDLDMGVVMEVFVSQLRLLLNLHTQILGDYSVADSGSKIITQWELDIWLRSRCIENLATSIASLQSLSQLLGQISNIVIKDDIGKEVQDAVESIRQSQRHLAAGRLDKAILSSRKAIISSEKAFFDPSLLELLYFPKDQKFAIYIPLFLPISLPVIASLWKAYKWMKSTRKLKTE